MTAVVIEKITSAITGEPSRSELIRQRREGLAAEKRLQEIGTRLEELFGTRAISRSQMAAAELGHAGEMQSLVIEFRVCEGKLADGLAATHQLRARPHAVDAEIRRLDRQRRGCGLRIELATQMLDRLRDPEDLAEIETELRELNAERERINRECEGLHAQKLGDE